MYLAPGSQNLFTADKREVENPTFRLHNYAYFLTLTETQKNNYFVSLSK